MKVSLEDAYAKACQIVGEQMVTQRLLAESQKAALPEPSEPEKKEEES